MPFLEAIFFILLALSLGGGLLLLLDRENKLSAEELIAGSAVLGLAIVGFLVLLLSLATRDLSFGLRLSYLIGLLAIAVMSRRIAHRAKSVFSSLRFFHFPFHWYIALLLLIFLFYLGILWQVMIWSPDGLPFSTLVGWGDGAYHLGIIARLATAHPFLLEQPIAAGAPLTYPFLFDFLSAIFKKIGLSDLWAWHIPAFLLDSALFWLVYFFARRIFKSKGWAVAFLFLIFFGGGFGFLWFFQDLSHAFHAQGFPGALQTLSSPPHEYTHLDSRTGGKLPSFDMPLNIVWMVPAVSFFSHQRSFILGAGLSMLFFLGFWLYGEHPKKIMPWLWLLGLLPLAHTHSFLSLTVISLMLFFIQLFRERRDRLTLFLYWVMGGVGALVVALPQVLFLAQAGFLGEGRGTSFFKPWLGWMTCTHNATWFLCDPGVPGTDTNIFFFAVKNFGLIFLLWIVAFLYFIFLRTSRVEKTFLLPSIVMFLLPNLLLFQPWEFDNNKILFYWWFFAALLSLLFLKEVRKPKALLVIMPLVLIGAGLSGSIDVWARVKNGIVATRNPAHTQTHFGFYGSQEKEIALWIQAHTAPNDTFLTSNEADQFIPMLTGRPIYLGFPGWLWTQGRGALAKERQTNIAAFVVFGNSGPLCKDGVRYWLEDSAFFDTYPSANPSQLEQAGEIVFSQSPFRKIIALHCPSLP